MAGIYSELDLRYLPDLSSLEKCDRALTDDSDGHLLEFPTIRVDCFTPTATSSSQYLPHPLDSSAPSQPPPNAQLFLLTHVHSDHLIGLSNSFTGRIICTPDTKRMLLRLESEAEKAHMERGTRETRRRKYSGLAGRWVDVPGVTISGKQSSSRRKRWVDTIVCLASFASWGSALIV
jgi:hypothetical protein